MTSRQNVWQFILGRDNYLLISLNDSNIDLNKAVPEIIATWEKKVWNMEPVVEEYHFPSEPQVKK